MPRQQFHYELKGGFSDRVRVLCLSRSALDALPRSSRGSPPVVGWTFGAKLLKAALDSLQVVRGVRVIQSLATLLFGI
jgi:hypothetical protein